MGLAELTGITDSLSRGLGFGACRARGISGASEARKAPDQGITGKVFLFFDLCLVWISGAVAYRLLSFVSPIIHKVPLNVFLTKFAGFLLLISILTVLSASLRGLYVTPWRGDLRRLLRLEAESVASAAVIAGSCMYLWNIKAVSLELFVTTVILSWVSLVAWRRFIEAQPIAGLTEKRNVLIAGCGKTARLLRSHLEQNKELGFIVKGFLDRRRDPRPGTPGSAEAEEGILGGISELPSIARAHFIDEIFVTVPSDRNLVQEIARYAFGAGINVRVVPDLCDGLVVDRPVEFIGSFPTMTLHRQPTATLQFLIKRLVDIVASGVSLIVLLPVFALIAAIIKLDSKGRIFYTSVRIGKKGKTFPCYKFRTMVQNADALKESLRHLNERSGILFKIALDPRITRVGRILRKFSFDELPQLWNVLKGDMSMVGPRPCVPSEYKQYSLEHLRRLDVVPGITGLWQVKARQSPSFEDYVSLDQQYVDGWNFWLDCKILWQTVAVVLAGTGQ